jgi:hypothetical protein
MCRDAESSGGSLKQGLSHQVKVKFYSGYKGEETPRSVCLEEEEIAIDRILERKKILDSETSEAREEYTIKLKGRKAILRIFGSGACELVFQSK